MLEDFLHKQKDDKRTLNQIILSEKLTQKLTELNIKRIKKGQQAKLQKGSQNIDFKCLNMKNESEKSDQTKTLFICMCGIPPFEDEFDNINFPGKVIKFVLPGFEIGLSEQKLKQRSYLCNFDTISDQIDLQIDKYPKEWSLIFVYHSFGTFMASFYFKNYQQKHQNRIKGIIDIGGGPIRVYPLIQSGLQASLKMTEEFMKQNIDLIYQAFNKIWQSWKQKGIFLTQYRSKYNLLGLFLCYKTKRLNQLFDFNRKLPKVVKLFIYGSKDNLFLVKNLDQKMIYYTYNAQTMLQDNYSRNIKQKYQDIHKGEIIPDNIQEKFIYKLKNGKHSVHMQKQFVPLIQQIIDDYLKIVL